MITLELENKPAKSDLPAGTDKFGCAERICVEISENFLGHVIETLLGQERDEVSLEDCFQVRVDVRVLVRVHPEESRAHKMCLKRIENRLVVIF